MWFADARHPVALLVVVGASWLVDGHSSDVVTVAQADAGRSARAPRTVDVSAEGRFIVFQSLARLVPADTNDRADVYLLDRSNGAVTLESTAADGAEASHPKTSGDGRYLVFEALDGEHHTGEIVLRDRVSGTSRPLTADFRRREPTGWSRTPVISADGRVVAFSSTLTSLVEGTDANGKSEDIYTFDVSSGRFTRVSVSSTGLQMAGGNSILPALSGDGRWLAFASTAPLADGMSREKPYRQIYLRDLRDGRTIRVTRAVGGGAPNGDSSLPSISGDGRYVVFVSEASNLLDDDENHASDVLLYDRETESLRWVSRGADGGSANGESITPVISADGRFVAFQSDASNLVCAKRCPEHDEDVNLVWDVFLFDRIAGRTARLSEDDLGGWMEASAGPAVDGTGTVVAFSSRHPVDVADRQEDFDLFVRTMSIPSVSRKFE
jgi:Tol biopolymer transport system component